jgi:hypothetical protein
LLSVSGLSWIFIPSRDETAYGKREENVSERGGRENRWIRNNLAERAETRDKRMIGK